MEAQLQRDCGLASHACVETCVQATTLGKVTPVACMATACMPEASPYATTPCSPAPPAPCPPRRSQIPQILYARAYTHEAQLDLLAGVAAKMVDEPFKLLIVDSIMANFRWGEEGPTERGMPTPAQVAGWGAACCCMLFDCSSAHGLDHGCPWCARRCPLWHELSAPPRWRSAHSRTQPYLVSHAQDGLCGARRAERAAAEAGRDDGSAEKGGVRRRKGSIPAGLVCRCYSSVRPWAGGNCRLAHVTRRRHVRPQPAGTRARLPTLLAPAPCSLRRSSMLVSRG